MSSPVKLVDHELWMDESICSETDPDAFFPEKGGSTREAKRICQGCPVRAECLEYALRTDQRFGIWGGFSERERRALKRGVPVEALIRRVRNERGHGFNCHCEECQQDREERNRQPAEPVKPKPAPANPSHGTVARYKKGCHCQPCRVANSAYLRECRANQRAADVAAAQATMLALVPAVSLCNSLSSTPRIEDLS